MSKIGVQTISPFVLLLGALLWNSCAADNGGTAAVVKTCALPSDQAGTLTGRWQSAPIPIALHQGDFSATESAAIVAAVATWNTFFTTSTQISILDDGGTTVRTSANTTPTTSTLCAMSDISGTGFIQPIVIYKDSTWPTAYAQQAMALTTYCRSSAGVGSSGATANLTGANPSEVTAVATVPSPSPSSAAATIQAELPTFRMAMTEVNYQYFYTTQEVPDLQTIMLHEFGHIIGLNHSCDNSAANGFPTCTGTGANPDYQNAVMYPVFGFDSNGNGQQRRALTDDDEERANCLYQ